MKDSRIGETLWSEWSGNDYHPEKSQPLIFYTEDHIDIHNELIRRALASAIQRDGNTDSLGEAFRLLDGAVVTKHGYIGAIDGDIDFTTCDENGMTIYEDLVEKVIPVTWVEINVD